MTNTKEYLAMSDAIRSARKARELHALSLEIEQSVFTTTEKDALHLKVTAAFGALNATAPVAHPKGRFTLLPRAGGSLLRSAAALGVLGVLAVQIHAAPISDSLAVNAIIGEAGNQSYATQVLVARAIHNRLAHGMGLTGVYGVNNPCVKQASAAVRAKAARAWAVASGVSPDPSSQRLDPTIKYFGCESDKNYFLRHGFRPVLKSGAITFYQ